MSTYLYHLVNSKPEKVMVEALEVEDLLSQGYTVCPKQLTKRKEADTNNTGKLSDSEIKEAAKKAGITIGRKSIKTLVKELGL